MDVAAWLRSLGLEQYAQTFRDNAIDETILPALSETHLEKLGLPLGHRLKLLQAITALRETAAPLPTEPIAQRRATAPERRSGCPRYIHSHHFPCP